MRRAIPVVLAMLLTLPVFAGDFEEDVSYQGRSLRDWLSDIRTGEREAQLRASRVLRLVGPEADGATAALLLVLKSDFQPDDLFVRTRLGFALGRLGPKQIPVLTAAIGLEDNHLAFGATRALGRFGPQAKPAARHLARLMRSSPLALNRVVAALAVWHVDRNADGVEVLRKILTTSAGYERMWAAWALEQLGPAAAPAAGDLVTQLASEDDGVRRYTFIALEAIGQPAVAPLVKAIDAKQARHSIESIEALGRLGAHADEAVPALIAVSDRGTPGQRAAAVRALGKIGVVTEDTLAALKRCLADSETDVRREASRALRALSGRAAPAAGALCQALREGETASRQAAAAALVRIGKPGVNTLAELLADKDELVRRQALDCLRDIGADASEAMDKVVAIAKQPDDYLRPRAIAALPAFGKAAAKPLIALLADDAARADAIGALGRLGPDASGAQKALIDLLTARDDAALRQEIIRVLGEIGPAKEVIAALVKLFEEDIRVRQAILSAFAQMPAAAKEWLSTAQKGLTDERSPVRQAALTALLAAGSDGKAALDDIVTRLKDDTPSVRQAAGQLLIILGEGKRVVAAVKDMLASDDAAVRQAALELAAWLGPQAKELQAAVRERLAEQKADLRLAAISALIEIDAADDSVVSPLIDMASDKARRASRPVLFRLLARSQAASERALALLNELCIQEDDWPARIEAARTLGAMGERAKSAVPALVRMLLELERMPDMVSAEARDLVVLDRGKEVEAKHSLARDEPDLTGMLDRAIKAVRTDGHDALDTLEDALGSVRDRYQGEILAALASVGSAAVPMLVKELGEELAERRILAARALEALGEQAKDASGALATACRSADIEFAVVAARALLAAGGDKEVSLVALRQGLQMPGITPIRSAHALALLGPAAKGTLPALVTASGSRYGKLRYEAVRALASFGDTEARPALERRLRDSSHAVRVGAAVGLARLAQRDPLDVLIDAVRDGTNQSRLDALAALAELGDKAKPAAQVLVRTLTDRSPEVRVLAARLLKKLVPERDVSGVLAAVAASSVNAETRLLAVRTIQELSLVGRTRATLADLAHEPSTPDALRAAARTALK